MPLSSKIFNNLSGDLSIHVTKKPQFLVLRSELGKVHEADGHRGLGESFVTTSTSLAP